MCDVGRGVSSPFSKFSTQTVICVMQNLCGLAKPLFASMQSYNFLTIYSSVYSNDYLFFNIYPPPFCNIDIAIIALSEGLQGVFLELGQEAKKSQMFRYVLQKG